MPAWHLCFQRLCCHLSPCPPPPEQLLFLAQRNNLPAQILALIGASCPNRWVLIAPGHDRRFRSAALRPPTLTSLHPPTPSASFGCCQENCSHAGRTVPPLPRVLPEGQPCPCWDAPPRLGRCSHLHWPGGPVLLPAPFPHASLAALQGPPLNRGCTFLMVALGHWREINPSDWPIGQGPS